MKPVIESKLEPKIQPVEHTPKGYIRMYDVGITSNSIENQLLQKIL